MNKEFMYMMLARLKSDCDYFLNSNKTAPSRLWAGNVEDQIAEMKKIYDSLDEKPDWITMEDIERYEKEMAD